MKTRSQQKNAVAQIAEDTELPSELQFKITKIAIAQICKSVGFKSTQLSALETLTDIATLYIKTIGKIAASYSNSSNRTESNLIDIINALHEVLLAQGFTGASTLHKNGSSSSVLSSRVLKEIAVFVKFCDEIPFAKPIPTEIPVPASPMLDSWLPRFPEESTYKKFQEPEKDKRRRKGMEVWENSEMVRNWCRIGNEIECSLGANKMKKKEGSGDLATERERVRFKIG